MTINFTALQSQFMAFHLPNVSFYRFLNVKYANLPFIPIETNL